MALNYTSAYNTSTISEDPSTSRLNPYSYYYQTLYGLPPNSNQEPAPAYNYGGTTRTVPVHSAGQGFDYYGTPSYPYGTGYQSVTGQVYQCGSGQTSGTVPTPKTVGGRPRSPVERVLRYRLDDNDSSSMLNSEKHSSSQSYGGRPSKKRLRPDNRGYNVLNKANFSTINEAMLVNNIEEKRSIDLQLNEAMFFDRLFEANFTSSWYKLKKKDDDGMELVCVVVEIIDCDKKVYKVYGGYTSNMRAKEMAFGQAIKKLNAIIKEREKEQLDKAKQLITNAIVSHTDIKTLPFTSGSQLVPNPLYNASTYAMVSNPSTYGQSDIQNQNHMPPGTETATSEYDPVNYGYDYHYPQQPLPPGTEKNFFEVLDGNENSQGGNSLLLMDQQQSTDSPVIVQTTDRPCAGRGDYEDAFTKKAKEMGLIFRCFKAPPKRHFNTEFFIFEIQFGRPNESRSKITGSSLRDEGQSRESAYAMALDKLKKNEGKQSAKAKNQVDYEYDWLTPVPPSLSLPKAHSPKQNPGGVNEVPMAPLRKINQAPNWDWDSTSNDLSIIKRVPSFSMGRGKPKNTDNTTLPGGDILDDREWRWPAC